MSLAKVIDYYNACHGQYLGIWGASRHLSMHYGYYDQASMTHNQAVIHMNRVLSERAHIGPNDSVLDAGCGLGGSSLWLAENIGCHVTGVSITPRQVDQAKRLAQKKNVSALANFLIADYLRLPFPDQTFSVVWALESVCHAEDKQQFLREAYRVLKPGGRLIVADFWRKKELDPKENSLMSGWLNGWAMAPLVSPKEFKQTTADGGLSQIEYADLTKKVSPSAEYLNSLYRRFSWGGRLFGRLGIWSASQMRNMVSARLQYQALEQGLWEYGIITAVRQ